MKCEEYTYITNSRDIVIKVKRFPNTMKGVSVSAYYEKNMALIAPFKSYNLTEEKSRQFVNEFCDMVSNLTDKDIQKHSEADKVMFALNIKRNLLEVKDKIGRTVWRKK